MLLITLLITLKIIIHIQTPNKIAIKMATDYTLFESNNQQEVTKKFKRTCELLIHFEGLQCIAANPEEHWIVFAEKCLLGKSNCNRLINMF